MGRAGRLTLLAFGLCSGGILVASASYALLALILGLLPANPLGRPAPDGVDVYLVGNGLHADLVLPLVAGSADWRRRLPLSTLSDIGTHLAFGWGDRAVYISTPRLSDLRASTVLGALSGFDETVMHVEAALVPISGASTRRIRLSPKKYEILVAAIDRSFRRDALGVHLVPGAHYGSYDLFFEAEGHYSIVLTCNEWVRRVLGEAGVRVPWWAPFETALFYQLPVDD